MKRYSEYKDSGVKWIGEIPGHWKKNKIMRLFTHIGSGTTPKGDQYYTDESNGIPWINSGDLNYGVLTKCNKYITEKALNDISTLKKYPINTLMIAMYGASIGKYAISHIEGCTNQACCALYGIKDELNLTYASYLMGPCKQKWIEESFGGTQPNISAEKIKQTWLPLPPLPEQEAIVTYLDSKVAKIDEYISIAEKKIAALEELKQTIIAEAVTRGIHKDVPMKDSGVKWIGMIPEHWDLIRAQNMVDCRKAGAWGEDSRKDERDRVCLRIADFDYSICRFKRTGDYTIRNYKQEQISSLYLNKGDILIEKSGGGEKTPVGRAILYDLDFYQPLYANFMEKITLREFASSSFYVYLLRTFYAKGCVWKYIKQTTGLQNLDLRAMLGSETFPVPPLPEQQEIVTYIEAKVANINQLCQAERSQIEKLKEYKQRLISDVVTGKVKVTND